MCILYSSSREARHSSNSHSTSGRSSVSDIYDAFSVRDPDLDSPPSPGRLDKPLMASSPQDTEVNTETDPPSGVEDAKDKVNYPRRYGKLLPM